MENLIGKQFGMLKVVRFSHKEKDSRGNYKYYWVCECECGNVVTRRSDGLKNKKSIVSCGCYRKKYLNSITSEQTIQRKLMGRQKQGYIKYMPK